MNINHDVYKPLHLGLLHHVFARKTIFFISLTSSRDIVDPCYFKGSADVVGVWRGLIGPPDVDLAKEESPASLRAKFGSSMVMNAVHGKWGSSKIKVFLPSTIYDGSRHQRCESV